MSIDVEKLIERYRKLLKPIIREMYRESMKMSLAIASFMLGLFALLTNHLSHVLSSDYVAATMLILGLSYLLYKCFR